MAIAWLLDQEGVIVIPKAARPESQRSNIDALGIRLDDEDRAVIATLSKDQRFVRPPFAPNGMPLHTQLHRTSLPIARACRQFATNGGKPRST